MGANSLVDAVLITKFCSSPQRQEGFQDKADKNALLWRFAKCERRKFKNRSSAGYNILLQLQEILEPCKTESSKCRSGIFMDGLGR